MRHFGPFLRLTKIAPRHLKDTHKTPTAPTVRLHLCSLHCQQGSCPSQGHHPNWSPNILAQEVEDLMTITRCRLFLRVSHTLNRQCVLLRLMEIVARKSLSLNHRVRRHLWGDRYHFSLTRMNNKCSYFCICRVLTLTHSRTVFTLLLRYETCLPSQ
jgi:hypothetical protein